MTNLRDLLKPIELDHLIEWHTNCAQWSAQSDDFGGARVHRERARELKAIKDGPRVPEGVERSMSNVAQRIAVLASGCIDKEPEQLSEQERIALAIVAGCNFEHTGTGIRVTDEFGIQKINGKFVVGARRPQRTNGE